MLEVGELVSWVRRGTGGSRGGGVGSWEEDRKMRLDLSEQTSSQRGDASQGEKTRQRGGRTRATRSLALSVTRPTT